MIAETLSELQLYINLLQQDKNIVYTDNNKLIADLKKEFNITVTIDQLNKLYDPTIDEEIIDKQVLLRNIFGW